MNARPWIFAITNLPFGVAGGYAFVAMPFFLRNAGMPVETIAKLGALAMLPSAYQLFWAPVLDLGIRRRAWLILVSVLSGICLAASLLVNPSTDLLRFEVLMVAGQLLAGLVASCNGALISTTLRDDQKGRAAGWVNAGNLGASALGGGLTMTLAGQWGPQAAAIGIALMMILPALAALTIAEPPPSREPLVQHFKLMAKDVWQAVRARRGWTGILFCISPVGTAALVNLFSALGPDFHASENMVEWLNGYAGAFVQAAGALVSGYFLDRVDRRKAYLACGVLTAVCGLGMALAPLTPTAFVVGTLAYMLVTGFCYAAFSAVVYEIVGTAGKTASTLYSVFPAAGNMAIAYVMLFDGAAHQRWGTRGVLATDAALNLAGVLVLMLLLHLVFAERARPASEPVAEAA